MKGKLWRVGSCVIFSPFDVILSPFFLKVTGKVMASRLPNVLNLWWVSGVVGVWCGVVGVGCGRCMLCWA